MEILILQLLRSTIELERTLMSLEYGTNYDMVKSLVEKNWEVLNKNGVKKD